MEEERERERKRENIARKRAFFNIDAKEKRIKEQREIDQEDKMEAEAYPWHPGYVTYKIGYNVSPWESEEMVQSLAERIRLEKVEKEERDQHQFMVSSMKVAMAEIEERDIQKKREAEELESQSLLTITRKLQKK